MCGKRQANSTAFATARASASISPDIITVTDVIATLSRSDSDDKERVDQVFQDAVDRGILLRKDSLDSNWEVDLAGMTLPVARAACRFIFRRILRSVKEGESPPAEMSLITGVGRAQRVDDRPPDDDTRGDSNQQRSNRGSTALREYVLQILSDDFDPPIRGTVPKRAQGTVLIEKREVENWIDRQ